MRAEGFEPSPGSRSERRIGVYLRKDIDCSSGIRRVCAQVCPDCAHGSAEPGLASPQLQVWIYAHAVFETAATRGALAILPTFGYQRRFVVVLHIIWLIILGLVVGLIARAIVPGRQPMGWIATAVLGIVGAYVGGTLGSVVFPPHQFDIHPPIKHAFLGALVGAVLLLVDIQGCHLADPDPVGAPAVRRTL